MAVRTFGDKPISFQLEENGEYFCVGSEVKLKVQNLTCSKTLRIFFHRWAIICVSLGDLCTRSILVCTDVPLQMRNGKSW